MKKNLIMRNTIISVHPMSVSNCKEQSSLCTEIGVLFCLYETVTGSYHLQGHTAHRFWEKIIKILNFYSQLMPQNIFPFQTQ